MIHWTDKKKKYVNYPRPSTNFCWPMRPGRSETLDIHALYASGLLFRLATEQLRWRYRLYLSGASSSNDIIDFPHHAGIAHFRIILAEITSQNRYGERARRR